MDFTLPENLPSITGAQLPKNYEAAKIALAACHRIDECKDWADKSAALASYAKMADDDDLEKYALRVRARAIQRCGELLRTYEAKRGGDRGNAATGGRTPVGETRSAIAEEAGLSPHQKKTALRLASIPEEEFTEAVESDTPPTITALAEQGTVKKSPPNILNGRDPADFRAATEALGGLRWTVELVQQWAPAAIVRGSDARAHAEMMALMQQIPAGLAALTTCIRDAQGAEHKGGPS
jgi:hypothetical protein